MAGQSPGLLALYLFIALVCVKPLGLYMAHVLERRPIWPVWAGGGLERLIYRLCGIDPAAQMPWKHYAVALLVFNGLGTLLVYALLRLQYWLPLNPRHFTAVSPDSSFNTAVSFVTNTNWQGYVPESTMSYLTQMAGLAVQNFLSAATGIVVAVTLIRGLARRCAQGIGNFWADITRTTLYVLLPIAFVLALALVSQGLIREVWGPERIDDTRSLRVCIKNLRGKLEPTRKSRAIWSPTPGSAIACARKTTESGPRTWKPVVES
jgi:K+-transporting ATPase ATPase A chain